jgi:hypothetical protein
MMVQGRHNKGFSAALALCASLGLGLAGAAQAQKINCLVVPLPGAKASVGSQALSAARTLEDCSQLQVREGLVQVVFITQNEGARIVEFGPGQAISLPEARRESDAFVKVRHQMDPSAARWQQPGGNAFESGNLGSAEAHGAPRGRIYIPAEGLAFALRNAAGARWQVLGPDNTEVAAGSADAGVRLPGAGLVPATPYRFVLRLADGSARGNTFTVANESKARTIREALGLLEKTPGASGTALAWARALLFEQQGVSFNGALAAPASQ